MKLYITILLMAGLLAGCNSNKRSTRGFGKKKTYSYSAKKSGPTLSKSSRSDSSKTISEQASLAPIDTAELVEDNSYYRERPRTNFQGASGVGTGGSYASSYYRQESIKKKKNKKEMYKNRNFDHMYQDENTAHLVPKRDSSDAPLKDSSAVIQADTTALEW